MKKLYATLLLSGAIFTFSYAQNVGVGTNTPSSRFEIRGAASSTSLLDVKDNANDSKMFITNAGSVGIGTIAPQHRLNVGATSTDDQLVLLRGYGDAPNWKGGAAFGYTNASVIMGELGGKAQIAGHNATLGAWADLIINEGGGFVGIGTNTPEAGLHILTAENGSTGTGILMSGGQTGNANIEVRGGTTPYLDFANDATTDFDARLVLSSDDNLQLSGAQLDMTGAKVINVATPTAGTDAVNKDYVDNQIGGADDWTLSGNNLYPNSTAYNVGIGLAGAPDKLYVQGDNNVNAIISINQVGTNGYVGTNIRRDGIEQWFIGMNGTDDDLIFRNDATTDEVIFKENGNVGIGIDPGFKLDVNGPTRLGGFTTANADEWPNLVWLRDPGNGWDEGLIKGNSTRGAFSRTGFGIHMDGGKHFGFFSSGWETLFDVEGGSGRAYIKGNTGIGAVSPGNKLYVSGDARATGNIFSDASVYWGLNGTRTEDRANAGLQGNAGARSGFYETAAPTPAANWPVGASNWWHLLDVRHNNPANNFAMQFSGSFFDQNLYFRKTNDNAAQPWARVLTTNDHGAYIQNQTGAAQPAGFYINGAGIVNSLEAQADNADARVLYHDPGDMCYATGIDFSDGRKFKINSGCGIGDNAHFTMGSNGYVGLGNTAIQHRLSVGPASADNQLITIRGYSNDGNWKGGAAFGYTSNAVIMGELGGVAQIGGHNADLSAWSTLALNSGGGNVGVGTTAPTENLGVQGNIRVSQSNATGGGILLADDGDIADMNDGFASMRFTNGVRFTSANRGGTVMAQIANGATGNETYFNTGNVGIGITDPDSRLHVMGRVNIHQSGAGGGQNIFTGLDGATSANGRGQLVISSAYSDLVVASSQANGTHGSTITLATYNPANANDQRKWVLNQGNWGARDRFLEIGYGANSTNPHGVINDNNTVMTMDGTNRFVGIGVRTPEAQMHIRRVTGGNRATLYVDQAGDNSWGHVMMLRTHTAGGDGPRILFRNRDVKNWSLGAEEGSRLGFGLWENGGDGVYGTGFGSTVLFAEEGGEVGIGTTDPTHKLHVNGTFFANGTITNTGQWFSTLRPNYHLDLQGDRNMVLYDGGAIWASNTGVSDIRYKKNVREMEGVLPFVNDLSLIRFEYKDELELPGEQFGVIAQEFIEKYPQVLYHDKKSDRYIVHYDRLSTLALKAIQEQQAEIDALKVELAEVKASKADASDVAALRAELSEIKEALKGKGYSASAK